MFKKPFIGIRLCVLYQKNLEFTKLDHTIIICAIVHSSSCNNSMAIESRNKFISHNSRKTIINADPIFTESPFPCSIIKPFCCVLTQWTRKSVFLELLLLRALILFVITTSFSKLTPKDPASQCHHLEDEVSVVA